MVCFLGHLKQSCIGIQLQTQKPINILRALIHENLQIELKRVKFLYGGWNSQLWSYVEKIRPKCAMMWTMNIGFHDGSPGTCCLWLLCCHFTGYYQTSLLSLATLFHLAIAHPIRSSSIPMFKKQSLAYRILHPVPAFGQTPPTSLSSPLTEDFINEAYSCKG